MMSPNKEYYAVIKGRVDEPTIFSSWGDAHPRVTGCSSKHKGFHTIEAAKNWMRKHGVKRPNEVIKDGAGETTPLPGSRAFYAVANGKKPGITEYWCGPKGSKQEVDKAEAFIADWKQSVAELYCKAIKESLEQGLRPVDMAFRVQNLFCEDEIKVEEADAEGDFGMGGLTFKEEDIK
ncbi:hypothetical protein Purlil1_12718 [Purpureocillium lilacinum]|uniref:Ribonuclease H1 N-terminal domain-containing protein n=1 Tax=Purpureocillium lilacinum TaxID=33203 RepID=A0ABR0BG44_PURLI|nr:hypothetical protein Purlil1_12718 [Purpureocillium lilacinum]